MIYPLFHAAKDDTKYTDTAQGGGEIPLLRTQCFSRERKFLAISVRGRERDRERVVLEVQ